MSRLCILLSLICVCMPQDYIRHIISSMYIITCFITNILLISISVTACYLTFTFLVDKAREMVVEYLLAAELFLNAADDYGERRGRRRELT